MIVIDVRYHGFRRCYEWNANIKMDAGVIIKWMKMEDSMQNVEYDIGGENLNDIQVTEVDYENFDWEDMTCWQMATEGELLN